MSDDLVDNAPVATASGPEPMSRGGRRRLVVSRSVRLLANAAAVFVTTVLLIATVAGFAGSQWWIAELASNLRLQLALGLLLCAVALAALRSSGWATVALVGGALNMLLVVSLYVPISTPSGPGSRPLRILLANVHRENDQHAAVISLVQGERPDIVMLLETDRAWMAALDPLQPEYPYTVSKLRDDDFGLAVLSRFPLTSTRTIPLGPSRLPAITTRVEMGDRSVTLLAAHPRPPVTRESSEERDQQLRELANQALAAGGRLVLCGDLNVSPWSSSFGALLDGGGLVNGSRGYGWLATWNANLPGILRVPIDHCLVSPDVGVRGVRRGPNVGSDHLPLIVDLAVYRR